jgi:hypothetical protein
MSGIGGKKVNLYKPDFDVSGFSICVLIPCGSYSVPTIFAKSLSNMIAYSWMNGLKIYQCGITERMVIDWARNDLARKALDHINEYTNEKFTHFLWLDDDHTFNPDLALYLARHNVDMVSALYYGRVSPHYPVVYVRDHDEEYKHYPLVETPETLFQCDAVGFGAMLMHRCVFEKVPEPWFTLDWRCGEDIAFCLSAKKNGIDIYCDGTYKLGHIAPPSVITEKNYLEYKQKNPEKFKDKLRVEL